MMNRAQKRKKLSSSDGSFEKKVIIVQKERDSCEYLFAILKDIAESSENSTEISVFLLTRYGKGKYRGEPFRSLEKYRVKDADEKEQ